MRYDKRVSLVVKGKDRYDPDLGRMVGGSSEQVVVPCHISPVKRGLVNQHGGKLNEASLVVRTRQYSGQVDGLLIDGQSFLIVETVRYGRQGLVFYVKEESCAKH